MIRKAIEKLTTKLSDSLSFSNSGLEILCSMVSGIARVWTVNLSQMSAEVPTNATIESTYPCSSSFMSFSFRLSSRLPLSSYQRANPLSELPHLKGSTAIFRKRRTENSEQAIEAGRDYLEVTAS